MTDKLSFNEFKEMVWSGREMLGGHLADELKAFLTGIMNCSTDEEGKTFVMEHLHELPPEFRRKFVEAFMEDIAERKTKELPGG
jgi:hypothetical protein